MFQLPDMLTIKQVFNVTAIPEEQVENQTRTIIGESGLLKTIKPNSRIAVGVGSRGIANLPIVVRGVCLALKEAGAKPFIFPAMGSHGGATSQGQKDVLHSLGITPETVGAEILSDAQGILAGETPEGIPVYLDRNALEADHVVVVNRVKAHTKFKGPFESGIAKMLSVGIGKVQGATTLHKKAFQFGFPQAIRSVAAKTMETVNFLFGLALIETPEKQLHSLSILTPETLDDETPLLKKASEIMARIPFDEIDLLIVDQIGKDISGTGMDTNVTGRNRDLLGDFCISPTVKRILVRDLTDKTQGNANGIGFADFTTRRLVDKIDIKKTYTNALAAMSPEKAAIPVTLENDRDAIVNALESMGLDDGKGTKIVRIKNTSELCQMEISEALTPLIRKTKGIKIETIQTARPMNFDSSGNLA